MDWFDLPAFFFFLRHSEVYLAQELKSRNSSTTHLWKQLCHADHHSFAFAFLDKKFMMAIMHLSDSQLSLRTLLSSTLTACDFSFFLFLMICLEILVAFGGSFEYAFSLAQISFWKVLSGKTSVTSPRDSQKSSPTRQFKSISSLVSALFMVQLSIHTWLLEKQ